MKDTYESRDEMLADYKKEHALCPNCGETEFTVTMLCIPTNMSDPKSYKDVNTATCTKCGWRWKVHELLPEDSGNYELKKEYNGKL